MMLVYATLIIPQLVVLGMRALAARVRVVRRTVR
jgi:hypothetical protein